MVPGLGSVVLAVLLAGCTSAMPAAPPAARSLTGTRPPTIPRTVATSTTSATTTPTTTAIPAFSSSVSSVTAAQLGATWHVGCPVDPGRLRVLQLRYWGFDDQPHLGTIVVNAAVVDQVIEVFSTLYTTRFQIDEMVPEAAYGGDDDAAAAADDTSGFNCRYAVAPGSPQWSMHAYGEAIDVNDVQNPYVAGSTIIPQAGSAYLDRSDMRPGMALPGGSLVAAFAAIGWGWGGNWSGTIDYQHFSVNGH